MVFIISTLFWLQFLFIDCGIRNLNNNVTTLIANGTKSKQSEFPWHAGLYEETATGEVIFSCGGSIISSKAILTAAHCVYDDTTEKPKSEKQLRVAVGKYRSNWNLKDSTEQKFEVIEIIIASRYLGSHNRYEQDIAILNLKTLIIFSIAVMPVCFDRDESLGLYKGPGTVGYVAGWGKTETGKISDVLLYTTFPTYDFYDCRNKVGNVFSQYITYDKFCAGRDGTIVQEGDSGGGLTFPRLYHGHEQHFIYGIVSLRPSATHNIAAFTNVTDHIQWIDKVRNAVQRTKSFI